MSKTNPQSETDYRLPTTDNLSGLDLDVWGGEPSAPLLIPQSPAECIAAVDGRCRLGCDQCQRFRREWEEDSAQAARGDPAQSARGLKEGGQE